MRKFAPLLLLALAASSFVGPTASQAAVNTMTAYPWMVPDEKQPRGIQGDAPVGWGSSSWQGPAAAVSAKSNFYVGYIGGNYWDNLFGGPSLVSQLSQLSYWTKKDNAQLGKDWYIALYTTTASGNAHGWYNRVLVSNFETNASDNQWNLHDSAAGMMFRNEKDNDYTNYSLGQIASGQCGAYDYHNDYVLAVSIQTASNWNGFDGYVDGLTIGLNGGNDVGKVDLEAVPEPGTFALLGVVLVGAGVTAARRRKRG